MNASLETIVIYVAVAALIFYKVIFTQMRGTLLSRKGLMLMPAILVVIGLASSVQALPHASAGELALLAADVLVLGVLGVFRSSTTKLTARGATTFQKGSIVTVGLWVLTIAVRFGFIALGTALGVAGPLTSASIALTIGISIAVQNATTFVRIQQRGLPLAADQRELAMAR